MHPHDIDWERLDRYVTGEGSPEEREALRRWAASDPAVETVAEVMRTAQRLPGAAPAAWDAAHSWKAVEERLGLATANDAAARPVLRLTPATRRTRWGWRGGLAAAAVMLLILAAAAGWWRTESGKRRPVLASVAAGGREYLTLRGQRLVVYLPDRTQVVLAPESRLRLAPDYGRGSRLVALQGQAYFVVTHDARHPFVVRGDRLVARDLGTRFVVRAYHGDTVRTVMVAEGAVELVGPSASGPGSAGGLRLEAGDLGRVASSGALVRTHGVPVPSYLAWTAGELRLQGVPIRDALIELRRWYDVDVELADSSAGDEQVTASFKDESALAAIDVIAAAGGLIVEQHGVRFTLRRP